MTFLRTSAETGGEMVLIYTTVAPEGKTNRKGMPNLFRLAVIMNEHFDLVRLPLPPAWMPVEASNLTVIEVALLVLLFRKATVTRRTLWKA